MQIHKGMEHSQVQLLPERTRTKSFTKRSMGRGQSIGEAVSPLLHPSCLCSSGSFSLAPPQAWHQGKDTQNTLLGGLSVARTLVRPALCTTWGDAANVCSAYCCHSQIIPRFLRCAKNDPPNTRCPKTVSTHSGWPQMVPRDLQRPPPHTPDAHSPQVLQTSQKVPCTSDGPLQSPHPVSCNLDV